MARRSRSGLHRGAVVVLRESEVEVGMEGVSGAEGWPRRKWWTSR